MKLRFTLLFCMFILGTLRAQTPQESVSNVRKELQYALQDTDAVYASLWIDSLLSLNTAEQTALMWDERWMLYIWMGWYGNVLQEVVESSQAIRELEESAPPPKDGLFNLIDQTLFSQRFKLYEAVRGAFLTEEERALMVLLIDYLLREDEETGTLNARIDGFLAHYPDSKYKEFLVSIHTDPPPPTPPSQPARSAISVDLGVASGQWQQEMGFTLRPMWAVDFGLGYWHKRFDTQLRFSIGGQKLNRKLIENGFIWPKNDQSTSILMELNAGYDLVHRHNVRLFPSGGAGLAWLRPPTADENEDPLPDYYDNFRFFNGYFSASLTADVRFQSKEDLEFSPGTAVSSGHGVRIRVGYRWLYWGKKNVDLTGNQIFVSVGYHLFGAF